MNKPSLASRGPNVAYRQDRVFGLRDRSLSKLSTWQMHTRLSQPFPKSVAPQHTDISVKLCDPMRSDQ